MRWLQWTKQWLKAVVTRATMKLSQGEKPNWVLKWLKNEAIVNRNVAAPHPAEYNDISTILSRLARGVGTCPVIIVIEDVIHISFRITF